MSGMYARSGPPLHQRHVALGRGNLAPPPGLDLRDAKITNPCVNRFRAFFLSELVLHYSDLTQAEIATIQKAVDAEGKSLTVVGSAARGGRTAASDIDYLFEEMPQFPSPMNDLDQILGQLPKVDPSHGPLRGPFNPYMGPGIKFTPGQGPVLLPGAN